MLKKGNKISSKTRVMGALNFQTLDRIPISYELFWPQFIEKWRQKKKVGKEVDINDWYGTDVSIIVADEAFFPSQKRTIKKEKGYAFLNDGCGRIVKARQGADLFSFPYQEVETVLKDK